MGKKTSTGLPAQPNNSLITGMDCLYAVINAKRPMGSVELARCLQKGHTTVNRLLGTLQFMGLLAQNQQRKYIPGPAIHVLAAQSLNAFRLLSITLQVIQTMPEAIIRDLIVALGVLYKENVLYLLHKAPDEQPIDSIHPAHLYHYQDSIIGQLLYGYAIQNRTAPNTGTSNNKMATEGYLYQGVQGECHEHKICFPLSHTTNHRKTNEPGNRKLPISTLREIARPIAGLAFVDRSCQYSEQSMLEIFAPYAIEICERLSTGSPQQDSRR